MLAGLLGNHQLATLGGTHQLQGVLRHLPQRINQLTLGQIDDSPTVEPSGKLEGGDHPLTAPVSRTLFRQGATAVLIERYQLGELMSRAMGTEASKSQP